jgi:hypothetical protein
MPMTTTEAERADHPSPSRGETGLPALLYGLMAAPIAWSVGEVVSATLSQEACFPGTEPLAEPALANLRLLQIAVFAISLLVSASAAMVALGAWRATRSEQAGGPHTLLSVGEGRSRFMALAGLLTSAGFALATLFSIPALVFVPSC